MYSNKASSPLPSRMPFLRNCLTWRNSRMISWQTRWLRLKASIIIETGRHVFIISPNLSTFRSQDQLIAELERLQLELDQLRSRPGGSYSRLVPFRHEHLRGSETLESPVWWWLMPVLCQCYVSFLVRHCRYITPRWRRLTLSAVTGLKCCWYVNTRIDLLHKHMQDPTFSPFSYACLDILL